MSRTDLQTALRFTAALLVIAAVMTAVFYGDEIGDWLADTLFSNTQSQIEQILK